ncbi:InlB B-repeat-containing protein [Ornithinibacillus sp. 179-J 7C1 HS]|uniref:InlB B-repeat-containing protein n=1 Tax=Ornithinibacillus sp. 179-J 7C1 HS TaxID=3142384 RepID=UPI0039A1710B
MIEKNKVRLNRVVAIFLAFIMLTYQLHLGLPIVIAQGAEEEAFTLQILNSSNPVEGAIITGNKDGNVVGDSRQTDANGEVLFPEITQADLQGNSTFEFVMQEQPEEENDPIRFTIHNTDGTTMTYQYDLAIGEGEFIVEPVTDPGAGEGTDPNPPEPVLYQVSVNPIGSGSGTIRINEEAYVEPIRVEEGSDVSINIQPASDSKIQSIKVNDVALESVSEDGYEGTITASQDMVIEVEFVKYYTITFNSNNQGIIEDEDGNLINALEGTIITSQGSTPSFTVTPNEGYHVGEIKVDGQVVDLSTLRKDGNSYTYTFTAVEQNHTVEITFSINKYNINAETVDHGEIAVSDTVVEHGDNVTLTLTPDEYYQLEALIVNGAEVDLNEVVLNDDGNYIYTLTNVTEDYTISAVFDEIPTINPGGEYVTFHTEQALKEVHNGNEIIYILPKNGEVKITPNGDYNKIRVGFLNWKNERVIRENTTIRELMVKNGLDIVRFTLEPEVKIVFDTEAPEVTDIVTNGDNEFSHEGSKWYSGNVTVSGQIDNISQSFDGYTYSTEIENVYYVKGKWNDPVSTENIATLKADNTFEFPVLDEEYSGYYTVWAVDKSGNISGLKYVEINIDKTNPSLIDGEAVTFEAVNDGKMDGFINFLTFGTFAKKAIQATVRVEDTGAGIKSIELIPNGEEAPTIEKEELTRNGKKAEQIFTIKSASYTGSFTVEVTDNLNHTERYIVSVENSNILANNSGIIMMEEVVPEASISLTPSPDYVEQDTYKKYFDQDVSFSIIAKDQDSGVGNVTILVNNEEFVNESFTSEKTLEASYNISTANFTSENGEYNVEVLVTDNAGNIFETNETVYVDKTSPVIKGIALGTIDGEFLIDNEEALEEYVELTEYGYYFKKPIEVTVMASDEKGENEAASGVQSMIIYLKAHAEDIYYSVDENGTIEEIRAEDFEVNQLPSIPTEGEFKFAAPENFKGQIIAKAIDNVENIGAFESIRGTIVESPTQHEMEEHIEMSIGKSSTGVDFNGKDLYDGDVDIDLTVKDTYSGIEKIEWTVEAPFDTGNNQSGTLTINNDGSFKKGSDSEGWDPTKTDQNLVTEMVKTLNVNHNSNDIVIHVKMTDLAGNISEEELTFSIDKTAPEIKIEYDYNDSDEENDYIYPEGRVATITITERNFDPEDVLVDIINESGGEVPVISQWTTTYPEEGKNPDLTTHVATINFDQDGVYTFTMSYKDNAGNEAQPMETDKFIIDKKAPEVSVTYDNNDGANGNYYKKERTATIEVREINFDEKRFAFKDTMPSSKDFPVLSEWVEVQPGVHQATVSFTEDNYYEYDIEVSDKAGNKMSEEAFAVEQFYIDKTAAVLADGDDDDDYAITFEQKNDGFFAKLINHVSFGTFFNKEVHITIDGKDESSGVESIELVSSDGVIIEHEEFSVDEDNLTARAEYVLDVDQFNDSFQVTLTDLAHNVETYDVNHENSNIVSETNNHIVVEKEKPKVGITVVPDENVSSYKNQYSGDVTFEIKTSDVDSGVATVSIDVNGKTYKYDYTDLAELQSNKAYEINTKDVGIKDDGSYDISVEVFDNAGNKETTSRKIYIDRTEPIITKFEFSPVGKSFTTIEETENLGSSLELTEYGYYFKERTQVRISAEDPGVSKEFTSGVQSITVYLKDYDNGKYYAVLKDGSVKEIKESGIKSIAPIMTKNHLVFTVPQSFKGQIFAQATDFVDNMGAYYAPDGTIVESSGQHVKETHIKFDKSKAPFKDNNGKDLYSSNVDIELTVTDTYSGISEIEWSVVAPYDTANNQHGSLKLNNNHTYAKDSNTKGWKQTKRDKNLVTEMKKTITVNNNSNDIKVKVKMTDRSGHTSEEEITFSIDKTAPAINVVYDNNSPDPEHPDFYNENRTATITITERNFNPEDVEYLITNTDRVVPVISGWSSRIDRTNPDLSTHTATISYTQDGDYTFDISFKDIAGNQAAAYAQDSFTIDKTKPVINVAYDTNNAMNGNYFNTARTATISVTEHNFDPSRIVITGTAMDDGNEVAFPTINGWASNGDVHTAMIAYQTDALYSFDIDYMDMAGNLADDFAPQEFYVDLTEPELSITGVEDLSANNGEVAPVITYSDTNFDENGVTIELVGANRGPVDIEGSFSDSTNGQVFTFDNFAELKENDDLYTLSATIVDLAGNEKREEIRFSVNRFGSVYVFDESLEKIVGKFVQEEQDIILTETNVDRLIDGSISIKMMHNGSPTDLVEGEDYTVTETSGQGQWSQYTYTIHKELFEGDGRYSIAIYSEDKAGNINENIDETKRAEISFGIDKTNPVIAPIDIEDDKQYPVDVKTATISIKDNLVLDQVKINLNDEEVDFIVDGDNYSFEIPNSNSTQDVVIVATDAAGNELTTEVNDILVTTNLFVRWYNNKPLFYGSLGGVGALSSAAVGYYVFRRNGKIVTEEIMEDKVG